jgi:hypothetical protein
VWGNMLLFAGFGYHWLGTRPLLEDPTYVGGFGYLRVSAGAWLPIFTAFVPVNALVTLVVVPGVAQVLSKLWRGQGRFEQMVNVPRLRRRWPACFDGVPGCPPLAARLRDLRRPVYSPLTWRNPICNSPARYC